MRLLTTQHLCTHLQGSAGCRAQDRRLAGELRSGKGTLGKRMLEICRSQDLLLCPVGRDSRYWQRVEVSNLGRQAEKNETGDLRRRSRGCGVKQITHFERQDVALEFSNQ
jgi:hypothetical protein